MHKQKLKSFTLSEMLVVMIITAIVVGMAFAVLRLVQKQVMAISANFSKTNELASFEHRLWLDFNNHSHIITKDKQQLSLINDVDTVNYVFEEHYVLRKKDTFKLSIRPERFLLNNIEISSGGLDAALLSAEEDVPGYQIFVYSRPDAAHFIN